MADPDGLDARSAALAGWLRDTLATSDFRFEPASEDASFRRYFRVTAGSRTWIAMDAPPPMEDCGPFVSVLGLLREAGVNAPALHAADVGRGFLLLDDLGSRRYLDVVDDGNADSLYADAFTALLDMQCGIGRERVPPYDERKLCDEMALFGEWFLARHLGIELGCVLSRALGETIEALLRACAEQPQVFVHRDYHSRNLMHLDRRNPGVIDFQDAVAGPITYDLVSLLRDVYIRWPERRVADWADAWHDLAVSRRLVGPGRLRFRRWFDLTGVQRHLKIAGIFCRLWHRDGKSRYLDDLPLTLAYLADIAPRHPETESVARILDELDVARRTDAVRREMALEAVPRRDR